MEMRKSIQDIYKVLTGSEKLLRLLYYSSPENALDNPLDSEKQNILEMNNKWDIIFDVVQLSPKVSDLDNVKKCRVLFYPGRRDGTNSYLIASQEFVFDILVNVDVNNTDQRLAWISDTINDLLFYQKIAGFGKVRFVDGGNIGAPDNYLGYRLVYDFCDFQK